MVTGVSELVVTGVSELVAPALLSRRVLTPRKQAQAQSVIPSKNQQKHQTWFKRLLLSQFLRALSEKINQRRLVDDSVLSGFQVSYSSQR